MAVYDFFLSRNNGPTVTNYVGHNGRLFYDPAERVLRISDGTTAGGEVFNGIVTVTATEPTQNFEGQVWLNPETFELSIYHDGDFIPTIDVATETKLGGVKLGPGVTVNGEGQIIIDSSGLDFSFGDFAAIVGEYTDETEYALLSSIKQDEDIVLASNGDGDIKVVGGFEVYATDGSVTASLEDAEPFFRILEDGQVRILVPLADTTEGGLEIIGSELGTSLQPGIAGTMLHLTGNPDLPTRVYHDTLGDYSSYVFRRYNGSVITPTQVLADEDIGRINWTAATDAGMGNVSTAQIRVTALENQTTTAQGSKITLTVTPVGSAASARVDVATITVADGITATKFTGPLTGNVTGDVTGNVTGNVSGSAGSVAAANITGTTLASGVTGSSLTSVGTLNGLTVNKSTSGTALSITATNAAPYGGTANWQFVGNGNIGGVGSWIQFPDSTLQATAWTGAAAAGTLTGTTLASNIVTSSLTTVGTLTNLAIAASGTITTPRVIINDGGIRTVSGGTTLTIDFATDSIILWTAPSGTAAITLSNYTAGAQVKLIIALTTTRDITFGISSAAHSSTGSDNWNGAGGGAIDIANTAVHLEYTCFTALAAGCYVKVTAN